ncbi:MAG TPA: hypothetical protein VNL34_00795 [Candidatus Nitrosotenuis sp.]|nr:hypothetical protein [Candidatus Nitrosotenuis sp.]
MAVNHPGISQKYPNFFIEFGEIKIMRDSIAHNTVAYEADHQVEHAMLHLHHLIITKQKKLTKRKMKGLMKKAVKCTDDAREAWSSVLSQKLSRL